MRYTDVPIAAANLPRPCWNHYLRLQDMAIHLILYPFKWMISLQVSIQKTFTKHHR